MACLFPVIELLDWWRGSLSLHASLVVPTLLCHFAVLGIWMNNKDVFWMACDSTEQLRAEYGPFHTREEAEREARKLGFGYLLRYEHILGEDEEIQEVRCVFVELQDSRGKKPGITFHTRCASCGESATHEMGWQAEVWADIHEFEHTRHKVRLFEHSRGEGLREIADWRSAA